jgi:predicted nuclease of predicted toxin-antitoxin system
MKAICDVHISYKLKKFLESKNWQVFHTNELLNKWNSTDNEISTFADENDLFVITKDVDFRNSYFINKKPKKIIRIILGNISNEKLIELFNQYLIQIQNCYQNNKFCYIEIGLDYFEVF